jgi:hypothetical protein
MQEGSYENRIARVKELLHTIRHAAIATVNEDGSPHNTPVFSTFDPELNFYWASGKATQHSKNIARDGRVFIILFDSYSKGGGLYLRGQAHELEGEELTLGLTVVNANRDHWQRPRVSQAFYEGDQPQRLYKAVCQTAWVNVTERDESGQPIDEARREVAGRDLLQ